MAQSLTALMVFTTPDITGHHYYRSLRLKNYPCLDGLTACSSFQGHGQESHADQVYREDSLSRIADDSKNLMIARKSFETQRSISPQIRLCHAGSALGRMRTFLALK